MRPLTDLADPVVGILLAQNNVTAKNRTESYGPGRLFVTEECVYWISPEQKGFVLSYLEISLHAISKDPSSFPEECIYVLLDSNEGQSSSDDEEMEVENAGSVNGNGNGMSGGAAERELCFVPEDKSALDAIFQAMANGQALHPDPADVDSEDGEEDDADEGMDGEVLDQGAGDILADGAQQDGQFDDDEDDDAAAGANHHQHFGSGDA
ncbi:hypothetical protein BV898_05496 [Hypsibius exemplaris]|uniref:Methylosome subunit pICln n=1 Tax=Hypsibius exemplaris TaxID=2072580 RepID=A0A1W0WZ15_HYPEX|nr:hypothetical protein BV898_05496 [Hypsibius exemplaris]